MEPVLQKDGPTHEAFLSEFLDTDDDKLQAYYGFLVFSGKGSMPWDADVIACVSRTKGAIGYVDAEASTQGVRELGVNDARSNGPRKLLPRVEPNYPETLRRGGIGGTVGLQVTVSANGNFENVELLGGNPILAEAAMSAVKQWIYSASRWRAKIDLTLSFKAHR